MSGRALSLSRAVALIATAFVTSLAPDAEAAGEAIAGFPNWAERVEHEWTNRARVDPALEMTKCGAPCGEKSCYSPIGPVYWSQVLNHSARFHSRHMSQNSYFSHPSACALVSTINSIYPTSCNAPASCSCVGGTLTGTTDTFVRIGMFGGSGSGEIIATPSDPNTSFYLWLYENSPSTTCAFSSANGHRWLILKSTGSVGYGVDGYSTGDFGGGGTATKIPSGSHYPRFGSSVELWANWYDTAAPTTAQVNIGGSCKTMTLTRGTGTNGAYLYAATGLTGCNRYYFSFKDSGGTVVTWPTTGSLGIGDTTCADWDTTRPTGCGTCTPACTGKTCGPDGCGGSCGTCTAPSTCGSSGTCVCTPACSGKSCGPDGCGGSCGTCPTGTVCNSTTGTCVSTCTPSCTGKVCGDDGCGGSCGTCPSGKTCSTAGACVCAPSCTGKTCGSDGCGGTCGSCTAPKTCDGTGNCACAPPNLVCAGACIDVTSDPVNCGVCGKICGAGEVCDKGTCTSTCTAPLVSCGGACVDLKTDPTHCGTCATKCGPTESCVAGACVPAITDAGTDSATDAGSDSESDAGGSDASSETGGGDAAPPIDSSVSDDATFGDTGRPTNGDEDTAIHGSCGCEVVGSTSSSNAGLAITVIALLLARRRRR